MVAVPCATPLTSPDEFTAAITVEDEFHTPPVTASASAVAEPTHTVPVPVILPATGSELTVTTTAAADVPQLLVTL